MIRTQPNRTAWQPEPPATQLDWGPVLSFTALLEDTQPLTRVEHARLVRTLTDTGVVASFDWPGWYAATGRLLVENPDRLEGASLEDCRRLLTALVGSDRFDGGHLQTAVRSGLVGRVLHRIAELLPGR